MIVKILLAHEDAIVRLPTAEESTLFATMINQKYPLIKNCWGAMDGLKLTLQRARNETQQKNFYNGWTRHEHHLSREIRHFSKFRLRMSVNYVILHMH